MRLDRTPIAFCIILSTTFLCCPLYADPSSMVGTPNSGHLDEDAFASLNHHGGGLLLAFAEDRPDCRVSFTLGGYGETLIAVGVVHISLDQPINHATWTISSNCKLMRVGMAFRFGDGAAYLADNPRAYWESIQERAADGHLALLFDEDREAVPNEPRDNQ